jgi:flagellar hook assembly protein FlgD
MREARLVVSALVVLFATGSPVARGGGRPSSALAELAEAVEARRNNTAAGGLSAARRKEKREQEPERAPTPVFYPSYRETVERFLALPGEQRRLDPPAGGASVLPSAPAAGPAAPSGWIPVGNGIVDQDKGSHRGFDRTGRATSLRWAHDHQQDAQTMYLGSHGGGLWKWILGSRWVPVSWNLDGAPSVGAFWIDPADSRRILIGSGEIRNGGTGAYLTEDEGVTWRRLDLDNAQPPWVFAIESDTRDPRLLLMATNDGLLRSDDRGARWRRLARGHFTDLVQKPGDPDRWYVAKSRLDGAYDPTASYTVHSYHAPTDVLAPLDPLPGPADTVKRITLAVSPAAPDTVFALVTTGVDMRGIYRSDAGGIAWQTISTRNPAWGQAGHTSAIAVSPVDPNILFVGLGGFEWTQTAMAPPSQVVWIDRYAVGHDDYTYMTMDPTGQYLAVTNDGGLYGVALQDLQSVAWDQISPFIVDAFNTAGGLNLQEMMGARGNLDARPSLALAGLQDNGNVRVDAGPGSLVTYLGGGDGGHVYIRDDQVFSGSSALAFTRVWSSDAGYSWSNVDCQFGATFWPQPFTVAEVYNGFPLMFTFNDKDVYFRDPAKDCASEPWRPLARRSLPGLLVQMEVTRLASGELAFFLSDGLGKLWVLETEASIPFGQFDWVDRSPSLPSGHDGGNTIVAPGKLSATREHVYFTTSANSNQRSLAFVSDDLGRTWREVTGTLAATLGKAILAELMPDPRGASDTFFLVSNVGVLRTDDGGTNWYRWMEGLPRVVDVTAIEAQALEEEPGFRLLIGTRGAGFFERTLRPGADDYAPTGTIVEPRPPSCHGNAVPLAVSVHDDSGIASVTYRVFDAAQRMVATLTGGAAPEHRATWNAAARPEGLYAVDAEVTDVHGNRLILPRVQPVRIEHGRPTVTMLDPPEDFQQAPWITTPYRLLRARASDAGCGMGEVRFNARYRDADGVLRDHALGAGALFSGTEYRKQWDVRGVPDQAKPTLPLELWVEAVAKDLGGNTAFSTGWILGFDRQAPNVAFATPASGTTRRGGVLPIQVTGSDPSVPGQWVHRLVVRAHYRDAPGVPPTWHVLSDRPQAVSWSGTLDLDPIPEQQVTLEAVATDAAGNARTARSDVIVDRTPPPLTLAGVAPDPLVTNGTRTAGISFTLGDPATVTIEIQDAAGQGVAAIVAPNLAARPHVLTWNGRNKFGVLLPSGPYTAVVQAADAAGNTSVAQDSFQLVADNRAPVLGLSAQTPYRVNPTPMRIEARTDEAGYAELEVVGGAGQVIRYLGGWQRPAGTFYATWDGTDPQGNRVLGFSTLRLRVTDAAGNTATLTTVVEVRP